MEVTENLLDEFTLSILQAHPVTFKNTGKTDGTVFWTRSGVGNVGQDLGFVA